MRVYDIIYKKRNKEKLTREEINFVVDGISDDSIPDYQLAAFLMASFLQGLDAEETSWLTEAMMNSGDILDLSDISPVTVDKHSTGGVGDKISLILAPAVAAGGGIVPMMSGRGLGHTGGTLDKLEAIPGYRIGLSEAEFRDALRTVGAAIIGQTGRLAPADKKLYALRDVTATVDSISLITGSIMSKKFAAGPASIVMDVKWGSGAFMKTVQEARQLARTLTSVGKHMGRHVSAFITDMNQPLGVCVGNALETREAIACLQGEGPDDVNRITRALAGEMLHFAKAVPNFEAGCQLYDKVISNGSAFEKFREMVAFQGGDLSVIDNPEKLPAAPEKIEIKAAESGYISAMDSVKIGIAGIQLGGGREKSDDKLDYSVGFEVLAKIGSKVSAGDTIAVMHAGPGSRKEQALQTYLEAISCSSEPVTAPELIVEKIS